MINKELAENVASAIKSCELEGFIILKKNKKSLLKLLQEKFLHQKLENFLKTFKYKINITTKNTNK